MKKIAAAKHLTDSEYDRLLETHLKHNLSMDIAKQKHYTILDIVKVERNTIENCLDVHYKNGDWWHYTLDGTWY